MVDRVVVGIGADPGRARDAVALARDLTRAPLTFVAAYVTDPRSRRREDAGGFPGQEEAAVAALEDAQGAAGEVAELVAVADLAPAHSVQRIAADRGADMIVVGSAHHGRPGRVLAGDVGRALLHAARCPVAVAPVGFDHWREGIEVIAVGFDGSPEAVAALTLAAGWAERRGVAVRVLCAWDLPPAAFTTGAAPADEDDAAPEPDPEEAAVVHAAERLVAGLADAQVRVVHGPAAEVLLRSGADLLVVGSGGGGPLRRVTLGSTADHLMHRARCPVLVVPRPAA